MVAPADRTLKIAEVAAVMRVSRMTVYRLIWSGELASERVGRLLLVPEGAVGAYLRGGGGGPGPGHAPASAP